LRLTGNPRRGGAVKATPFRRGGTPWRAESPGELRAGSWNKPPASGWRTLVWSKTLKAGRVSEGSVFCLASLWELRFLWRALQMWCRRALGQRHEGMGAGNGVRLRERSKALKGEPQERIRSETMAGRHWADRSVRRLRKPGDAGVRVRQPRTFRPLPIVGIRCRGRNLREGAVVGRSPV
jgi:hypothetical protein